jgi:hypothetical protein
MASILPLSTTLNVILQNSRVQLAAFTGANLIRGESPKNLKLAVYVDSVGRHAGSSTRCNYLEACNETSAI